MTTNQGVARAWIAGVRTHSQNMSTDGTSIWSYALRIGCIHNNPDGTKHIYIRNARSPRSGNKGGRYYSMTTSTKHMGPTLDAAHRAASEYGWSMEIVPDANFDTHAWKSHA